MKRFWQVSIVLSLAFALVMNFLVGAQVLDLPAINVISDKYATPLTPAGYAFSIWSVIYVLLTIFAVYQARDFFRPKLSNDLPQKAGLLFVIASICNGLWTYIFVNEWIAASVVTLVLLTGSLYALLYKLRIATYEAPRKHIICVWWPLMFYSGWVTVATVVNIASWFVSMNITITFATSIAVIAALTAFLIWLIYKRNVRELALASAWGIAAVAVQQSQAGGSSAMVAAAALSSSLLVVAAVAHAIKNHALLQFKKTT